MTQNNNILTPDPGKMLTQAGEVEIADRIITSAVHLAVNDSPDRWREITEEEAEAIRFQQEEAARQRKEVVEQ